MASYFVAYHAPPDGEVAVHDRHCCPPASFPHEGSTEYLGEFLDPEQAIAVARIRYAQARCCDCSEQARPLHPQRLAQRSMEPLSPG
jgi:hypothetical protein